MATMQEFATAEFQTLNRGYNRVFRAGELSVGLVTPDRRMTRLFTSA